MNRTRGLALLVAAVGAIAPLSALAQEDPKLVRGRELFNLWREGKVEEMVKQSTEAMQKQFPPPLARQAWAQLEFQVGKFVAEKEANLVKVETYDVARLTLDFERGLLILRVIMDDQGRLAGLRPEKLDLKDTYTPPDYVDKARFKEEPMTVSAGPLALKGTLSIPVGDGPFPALVLVHGSGPHDQDETVGPNRPFRDLSWGLASNGIAVLRYEKRTKAHPTAIPADAWTLETETIDDAVDAARLLRERKDIDPRRVFVLGHSLGGMAAPYIGQRDPQLAGLVILAGSARSLLDLIDDQIDYLAGTDGIVTKEETAQLNQIHATLQLIREGKIGQAGSALGMPAKYLADLHIRKPAQVAAELAMPMLVIQGGRDYQVTTKEFDIWQAALKARPNVSFKLYDELNHLMISGKGPSTPQEYQVAGHMDPSLIHDLAEWLHKQPAAAASQPAR